jgi:hypothetical protein
LCCVANIGKRVPTTRELVERSKKKKSACAGVATTPVVNADVGIQSPPVVGCSRDRVDISSPHVMSDVSAFATPVKTTHREQSVLPEFFNVGYDEVMSSQLRKFKIPEAVAAFASKPPEEVALEVAAACFKVCFLCCLLAGCSQFL